MAASVRLVGLAEDLLPVANKNVISDLAAAAAAITAAAVTAQVNIEANLAGIKDEALAAELAATAALADGVADRAGPRVIARSARRCRSDRGRLAEPAGELATAIRAEAAARGRRAHRGGAAAAARRGHRERRRGQRRLRPVDRQRRRQGGHRLRRGAHRRPQPGIIARRSPSWPTTPKCTGSSCRPRCPKARTSPTWRAPSRAGKDVDGASPESLGRLVAGLPAFAPATAEAVLALLDHYQVELRGRHAVVVGRSVVVGKPAAHLLLDRHATVTICHSRTADLAAITRQADVLVVAAGRAGLIGPGHVSPGTTVIDVGTNATPTAASRATSTRRSPASRAALTPVPGGVGPVTTALLLSHVVEAAAAARLRAGAKKLVAAARADGVSLVSNERLRSSPGRRAPAAADGRPAPVPAGGAGGAA